jgi:hypothetical protein
MNPREGGSAYQRRQNLSALVNNGHVLPVGAEELIEGAIKEHDQAFDPRFQVEAGIGDVETEFIVEIPHGNPDGEVRSGTIQRLSIRLEAEELSYPIVPAFFVPVSIEFEDNPQVPIYPDNLRYLEVDKNGNSNPVVFMLAIPGGLAGKSAAINVSCGPIQSSIGFIVK